MDRKKIIQNLRNKRYTYQQIGDLLGLSRQRTYQILNYVYIPRPRQQIYQTRKRMREHIKKCTKPFAKIPPNWKPPQNINFGIIKQEGRDFLKEKVRIRDNHICQICDKIWEKGQRRFDVHHLDENLEGENGYSYQSCKNLDRQITLCHKCHLNLKHIKEKFSVINKSRIPWNKGKKFSTPVSIDRPF